MLYSKPCAHAIRALAHLADPWGPGRARLREIARDEGLPVEALGKIMQRLVRRGLLRSRRGPGGGFSLARAAEAVTLLEVVEAVDGLEHVHGCAVGLPRCGDASPCPLHHTWKGLREHVIRYLERTTLSDMARALARRRRPGRRRPGTSAP